jgi:hypothetical protein
LFVSVALFSTDLFDEEVAASGRASVPSAG